MHSVYHEMMGKKSSWSKGEAMNGKINIEMNLTLQETGFKSKQLDAGRKMIY